MRKKKEKKKKKNSNSLMLKSLVTLLCFYYLAYLEALNGKPSEKPTIEMCIGSSLDPTLAPRGKHVVTLFVQYTPYHLKEGSWADIGRKEAYADKGGGGFLWE